MSSGLFDPTTEAFTSSLIVTIVLLVVAICIGLFGHFQVFRKREKAKEKELAALSKFDNCFSTILCEIKDQPRLKL